MFPPSEGLIKLDLDATSGISGSISIACWVVVFSPQIIENFRRQSADGLSVVFLIIWLLGDVFNIIGAILQGVLPTMLILAIYYTFADIVLVLQVFYYRGLTFSDTVADPEPDSEPAPSETEPLLSRSISSTHGPRMISSEDRAATGTFSEVAWTSDPSDEPQGLSTSEPTRQMSVAKTPRRPSFTDFRERSSLAELGQKISNMDGVRLMPTAPLVDAQKDDATAITTGVQATSGLHSFFVNTTCILMVCSAGVMGWWIGQRSGSVEKAPKPPAPPEFHPLGQVFGYLCAVFYLGSRVPQLLLNFRRKSTEGVSLLFFLFACIGNITYVLSILAYSPTCANPEHCLDGERSAIYGRYVLVNLSWIVGSAGTLFLDLLIFWQFFLYKTTQNQEVEENG